jgi:hypothetical protein
MAAQEQKDPRAAFGSADTLKFLFPGKNTFSREILDFRSRSNRPPEASIR